MVQAQHVFVDAMNVIGARPDGWWRDRPAAVRRLADDLVPLASEAAAVTMVVDGDPHPELPEGRRRGVMVLYAGPGPNAADDRIVAELQRAGAPPSGCDAHVVVVTADRVLRERVRAQGAATAGPSTLRRWLDDRAPARSDDGAADPRSPSME